MIPTLTAEVIVMVTPLEVEVGEEVVLEDMMGIGIDMVMVSYTILIHLIVSPASSRSQTCYIFLFTMLSLASAA